MAKLKMTSSIISQEMISPDIYSMWLSAKEIAEQAAPGQFISLYCEDSGRILPRPISICEIDKEKGTLRIVYRIAGKGTAEFSQKKAGDTIEILGPLGNGFPMEETEGKRVFLMGGGIGIPPMLETAKEAKGEVTVIAGYRDKNIFLQDEFEKAGKFVIATEDGSLGMRLNEQEQNVIPVSPYTAVICGKRSDGMISLYRRNGNIFAIRYGGHMIPKVN